MTFTSWRAFFNNILVTAELPPSLMGDYHLTAPSPAVDFGAASKSGVNAPDFDFDNQMRPTAAGFDSGADEYGADDVTPPPPPPDPLPANVHFSTAGNTDVPGLNNGDDADIYNWDGSVFSRVLEANGAGSLGLPGGADVDGFEWVDADHFYMSFTGTVNPPGSLGNVQDEDVVYYNNGTWSLFFDGSANGIGGTDLDAISIVGSTLYFSTTDNDVMPGTTGPGDDADIYRWDGGNSYTRIVDATTLGIPGSADVDGLIFVDDTHFYLTFNNNTGVTITGFETVQDEDVVYYDAGTWSIYFDATSKGLNITNGQDLDAIDLP
jgi:hypothetical protein